MKPDNMVSLSFSLASLGFFALGLVPVALELTVEYTFPIAELISSALLLTICSLVAFVFIFMMSALLQTENSQNANWFCLGALGFGLFASFFLTTDYKRLQYDSDHSTN